MGKSQASYSLKTAFNVQKCLRQTKAILEQDAVDLDLVMAVDTMTFTMTFAPAKC